MIKLFPYQKIGVQFLRSKKFALLADDMGLGKTAQAIIAAKYFKKVLVVCPSVAKYNWQNEFLAFDNRISFVSGEGKTYHKKNTVIISFNYLIKYLAKYTSQKWDIVIIDEVHMVKTPGAERTMAAFGDEGIIRHTKRLWAMSGTPAPNHAGELWVLFYTFGYTKLGYAGFLARYCNIYHASDRFSRLVIEGTNIKMSHELRDIQKKMSLRRLKKDVLDLPPIFHNTYYIKGDSESAILKAHPELKSKLREENSRLQETLGINLNISDDRLISSLQFLGQSISALRRYHGFRKIKETAELIDFELESKAYNKIIVFGIHSDILLTLQKTLSKYKSVMIKGGVSDKNKKIAVDQFQNDDKTQIFYGNITAAGVSITLTAADQVIFIEDEWVPGLNRQAADRAHRIGQNNTVNVRHIAIKDSLDAKITAVLVRKIKEISTFID